MNQDQIMEAMNYIDPALIESADVPESAVRRVKWPLPALIAACLCLVLAGTAVAMGITGTKITGFFRSEDGSGYTYEGGVRFYTVDSLSKELITYTADEIAAGREMPARSFQTRQEMETFIGVSIMDNPILDHAEQGYGNESISGFEHMLLVTSGEEGPTELRYSFICRWDGVRLTLDGRLYTELAQDNLPEDFQPSQTTHFCSGAEVTSEGQYTAPSGLEADLVLTDVTNTVHGTDGTGNHLYTAVFSINGIQFILDAQSITSSGEDPAHTLTVLKEVLDAFTFPPAE